MDVAEKIRDVNVKTIEERLGFPIFFLFFGIINSKLYVVRKFCECYLCGFK